MTDPVCKSNEKYESLHLKYWLFISVLVLIAVANERWSSQPKFTEYLSNAATMTSLMLGLVAILYSFVANNGLAKSLGNISVVSEEVRKSKEQISEYLDKTKEINDAEEDSRKALQDISTTLSENLTSLRNALAVVSEQTGLLPSRMDQLASQVNEAAKAFSEKSPKNGAPLDAQARFWTDSAVQRFCERQTISGNLLAYACVLANEKDKEISIEEFAAAIGLSDVSFPKGVFSAMHSCQIVTGESVKDKNYVFKIISVDDHLKKIARDYFESYAKATYSGNALKSWLNKLESVEALFP